MSSNVLSPRVAFSAAAIIGVIVAAEALSTGKFDGAVDATKKYLQRVTLQTPTSEIERAAMKQAAAAARVANSVMFGTSESCPQLKLASTAFNEALDTLAEKAKLRSEQGALDPANVDAALSLYRTVDITPILAKCDPK